MHHLIFVYKFVSLFLKWINKDSFSIFPHNHFSFSLFPFFSCFLLSFPGSPQTHLIVLPRCINFVLHMEYKFIKMVSELFFWRALLCIFVCFFLSFFLLALFLSFVSFFSAMVTESEFKSIMLANDFNDPHNFLYLHLNENPSLSLVSLVLESQNYHSWSKSFATTLSAKNKMQFIDGSAPEPEKTNPTYQAWKRYNNMVVSWLTHLVSSGKVSCGLKNLRKYGRISNLDFFSRKFATYIWFTARSIFP